MQHLTINNLFFQYPNSHIPIFQNLNLEFSSRWSCLVGANGSGKSTLLKLISKELQFAHGFITGNDLVHYCAQSTEYKPKYLDEFILAFDKESFKIKDLLKIENFSLASWEKLSCGERKRVQLAIALYKNPDVLLVDEPTNHLDATNKSIIVNALKKFANIGVLVSHDREVLEALSEHTIMLKNKNATTFKTSFSKAMNEHKKQIYFLKDSNKHQKEKLQKVKKAIQNTREKISLSKKRFSKKVLEKKDSDARNKINLAKLTGKDKKDGKTISKLQTKQKQLLSSIVKVDKEDTVGIKIVAKQKDNIFPIIIESSTIKLLENKSLSWKKLTIYKHEKIGITGDNGVGKSTFLNFILKLKNFKNECVYIPQEVSEKESKEIFNHINSLPNSKKSEIYTIVKKLSSDASKIQQTIMPSLGEMKKLMLAKGIFENPACIILDEPTNHMDLDSVLILEKALQEYDGLCIVVSHDRNFLHNITNKILNFKKIDDTLYEIEE